MRRNPLAVGHHAISIDLGHDAVGAHRHAERFEIAARTRRQRVGEAGEQARPALQQEHAGRGRIDAPELTVQRVPRDLGDHAGELHAGGTATDDHEREQCVALACGARAFGRFERQQKPSAHLERIFDALEAGRVLLPLRVPEVPVPRARGEHEIVKRDLHRAAVQRNPPRVRIDTIHVGHHHGHVGLIAQQRADRHADVRRVQHGGGDLIQQRLEQVVIGAIEERDAHGRVGQSPRGRDTGEPAADDHHMRTRIRRVAAGHGERGDIGGQRRSRGRRTRHVGLGSRVTGSGGHCFNGPTL